MATHSSVLAWRIPGTEEPGGLPSMGSHSRTQQKWLSSSSSSSSVVSLVIRTWGWMWSLINRIDNEKRTLSIQGSGRGESATGTEAGGRAARRTQGWPGERILKGRRVLQRHSGACRVGEDWTVPAALKHTPPVTVAGSGLAELTGQKPDESRLKRKHKNEN